VAYYENSAGSEMRVLIQIVFWLDSQQRCC